MPHTQARSVRIWIMAAAASLAMAATGVPAGVVHAASSGAHLEVTINGLTGAKVDGASHANVLLHNAGDADATRTPPAERPCGWPGDGRDAQAASGLIHTEALGHGQGEE